MGLTDLLKRRQKKRLAEAHRKEEEAEIQRQKREEEAKEKKRIYDALNRIIVFPGSREEFEEYVGYKCCVIDTGRSDKGIIYMKGSLSCLERSLVDAGIVGIINAVPTAYFRLGDDEARYGLPVAKQPEEK